MTGRRVSSTLFEPRTTRQTPTGRRPLPLKQRLLVIANQTVGSAELRSELHERCRKRPTAVMLLLPHRYTAEAEDRLARALAELREDGVEVAGRLSNPDPFMAAHEEWDPATYDEILISTLPSSKSRWLSSDLPPPDRATHGRARQDRLRPPAAHGCRRDRSGGRPDDGHPVRRPDVGHGEAVSEQPAEARSVEYRGAARPRRPSAVCEPLRAVIGSDVE
jgi:hypothetical protein